LQVKDFIGIIDRGALDVHGLIRHVALDEGVGEESDQDFITVQPCDPHTVFAVF
jgi:hypothetical protein